MKGAPWAIFATILFGVSTPLAKLLLPHLSPFLMAGLLSLSLCSGLGLAGYWLIRARTTPTPITGTDLAPLNWTTQQDHQNMKEQLGITRLRPGPSGNASATNAANYDITKANPFPNLPEVLTLKNGQKVGIEGVSRFGKAALVTLAFEPRFAVVLVGSSGEGGAKLHRRNFGEAVEDLTGSGEYHWMAGNFQKYGTAESKFGSKNAGDLPVDAHELIALCAPRPTFISYGIPERGDAHWLDQQGSYMATVAAGPVFRLLGARDLGDKDDYRVAKMPPVNTDRLDGELAWRQHDGGHEDRSNMKHFIAWASKLIHHTSPAQAATKLSCRRARSSGKTACGIRSTPIARPNKFCREFAWPLLPMACVGRRCRAPT